MLLGTLTHMYCKQKQTLTRREGGRKRERGREREREGGREREG